MPSASVIKLLSNPRIPINALAYGSGINRNSRVANQLNNLASGINYYIATKNNYNQKIVLNNDSLLITKKSYYVLALYTLDIIIAKNEA